MVTKTRQRFYSDEVERIAEINEHSYWGDLPRKYKKKKIYEDGIEIINEDFFR